MKGLRDFEYPKTEFSLFISTGKQRRRRSWKMSPKLNHFVEGHHREIGKNRAERIVNAAWILFNQSTVHWPFSSSCSSYSPPPTPHSPPLLPLLLLFVLLLFVLFLVFFSYPVSNFFSFRFCLSLLLLLAISPLMALATPLTPIFTPFSYSPPSSQVISDKRCIPHQTRHCSLYLLSLS